MLRAEEKLDRRWARCCVLKVSSFQPGGHVAVTLKSACYKVGTLLRAEEMLGTTRWSRCYVLKAGWLRSGGHVAVAEGRLVTIRWARCYVLKAGWLRSGGHVATC